MNNATVDQWVNLFKEIGLSEKDMKKWHSLFEEKYPAQHQSFLEWLNIEPSRIDDIRKGNI